MGRKKGSNYTEKVEKFSLGVFHTITDICLFTIFFHLQSYSIAYGKRDVIEAINQAVHLTKIYNNYNLQRLLYRLQNRGYLERKENFLRVTSMGQERLTRILPKYEHKRPWDGILYLITYDIPENRKKDREYLRRYLQQLGCGLLQKSVWLTPYNPKGILSKLIKEGDLAGLVLISELKEGSAIGGRNMLEVIARVYKLEAINEQYKNFLGDCQRNKFNRTNLIMRYLGILKQDPQLPFPLLSNWWLGEEAYLRFKKL